MLMFAQRCALTNSPLLPRATTTWYHHHHHRRDAHERPNRHHRSASAVVLARPPSVELLQCWDEPRRSFQRAVSDEVLPQHLHADARASPVLDVVCGYNILQLQNSGGESKRLTTWPRLGRASCRRSVTVNSCDSAVGGDLRSTTAPGGNTTLLCGGGCRSAGCPTPRLSWRRW